MFIFFIVLIVVGIILFNWLKPYLEYKKIGSYAEYKPVSKSLNDKSAEYEWYQINGFKNINQVGIKYLQQMSDSYTKNDLKWLNECKEFLEEGLIKAGENQENKFSLPQPIEDAGMLDILKVIKRSRKQLPEHYQKIGCTTCGEAVVMHIWYELRIQQINNGEPIKSGDMNYIINSIKEVQNNSLHQ